MTLTITTYDWVPEFPRGLVRDIRARWACEEAGLDYRIDTVPLHDKTPDHLARQPFHQVPMLRDGDLTLFESGAIALHIAEKSETLMPRDPVGRAKAMQWVLAALNSVEMWSQNWVVAVMAKDQPVADRLKALMDLRLSQLDAYLDGRDWLDDRFTIGDLMMADVLRLPDRKKALAGFANVAAYLARVTARPAFEKALADQMAHFATTDQAAAPASG